MPPTSIDSTEWLSAAIKALPSDPDVPIGTPGYNDYTTQKAHWLGWLKPMSDTGTYRRAQAKERDAKDIYNRIVEPKMLLWIAEAAGVSNEAVAQAHAAVNERRAAGAALASQAAAVRKAIPWGVLRAELVRIV